MQLPAASNQTLTARPVTQRSLWLDRFSGTIALSVLAVALVAVRTLLHLGSHFWLDETESIWMAQGGLAELPHRIPVLPMSIPYAWLMIAIHALGARAEWIYRVPSVLAVAAASSILFRILLRLWGKEAAWLGTAVFVSVPEISWAARNARPYAIGVLLVIVSLWFLSRLLERPSLVSVIGCGVAAGLVVHFQLLFAGAILAQALYAGMVWLRGRRIHGGFLLAAGVIASAIAALAIPFVGLLASGASSRAYTALPSPDEVLTSLFAPPTGLCLLAFFIWLVFKPAAEFDAPEHDAVVFGLMATLVPVACAAAISWITKNSVWVSRYYMSYAIGLAFCFGALAGGLRPRNAARWIAVSLALMQLAFFSRGFHNTKDVGDWAAGVAFVDRNTAGDHAPVLIRSQYMEGNIYPVNPVRGNGMFTQLACYPSHSRLIGLATTFGPQQARNMDELLRGPLAGAPRFLLLASAGPSPLAPYTWYLSGRLGPGAAVRELANFDGLTVLEFRPGAARNETGPSGGKP